MEAAWWFIVILGILLIIDFAVSRTRRRDYVRDDPTLNTRNDRD